MDGMLQDGSCAPFSNVAGGVEFILWDHPVPEQGDSDVEEESRSAWEGEEEVIALAPEHTFFVRRVRHLFSRRIIRTLRRNSFWARWRILRTRSS
jgi:hypothetical protein